MTPPYLAAFAPPLTQNIARLCGATGAGVAAKRPKRPRQGAAAAARPSVSLPIGENGANFAALPDFFDFSAAASAA